LTAIEYNSAELAINSLFTSCSSAKQLTFVMILEYMKRKQMRVILEILKAYVLLFEMSEDMSFSKLLRFWLVDYF